MNGPARKFNRTFSNELRCRDDGCEISSGSLSWVRTMTKMVIFQKINLIRNGSVNNCDGSRITEIISGDVYSSTINMGLGLGLVTTQIRATREINLKLFFCIVVLTHY